MKRAALLGAICLALLCAVPLPGFAQMANPDTAPVTGMKPDRTTAPRLFREAMQKREAVKRKKRATCRAKARAEKVSLLKRPGYVRNCVAQPD
jgi:hypothetical protein